MKTAQELSTNSSQAAIAVHSMAVQTALVARSSRSKMSVGENTDFTSADEELDAVVSAKFLGDVVEVASSAGSTLASAGMAIGSAIGNAAVVVGNHVVKTAETMFESLPGPIQDAANSIGNVALGAINAAVDAGEMVAATTVNLAGTALDHATRSLEEGAKLSSKVGKFIADKAAALGGEIAKLGPLAAGLASAAWDQIKKFVNCLREQFSLCSVLIGDRRETQLRSSGGIWAFSGSLLVL